MEELNYTSTKIFTRNRQGELIEKRVKAAQVCPGLLVTPEKSGMVDLIIEYNGIKWRESQATLASIDNVCKRIPGILKSISEGHLLSLSGYHKEMHRRIFNPDVPAVMELKKPERKPKQPTMNNDGTIRAKVLQYKADGNTLTEKWETLTKFAEGVYYAKDTDTYGYTVHLFFFEDNGVYWYSQIAQPENQLNHPEVKQRVIDFRANFRANLKEKAANNAFISTLQIEAMRRLGEDVAPLLASREAYLKQREEEELRKAEEAQRREREAKEAEDLRKAELLAEGRQNLMEHKAVTVEQIELLAETVGYKIHIRTLGFMREKVTEVQLTGDDSVRVWSINATKRSIQGVVDAVAEIAERLRAQAEEEAGQAAQATETPQISTETAEAEEVSAENETMAEDANIEPVGIDEMESTFAGYGTIRQHTKLYDGSIAAIVETNGIYYGGRLYKNSQGIYFVRRPFNSLPDAYAYIVSKWIAQNASRPPGTPMANSVPPSLQEHHRVQTNNVN